MKTARVPAAARGLLVAAMMITACPHAGAQVAVSNLLDAQNGNLPFSKPESRVDLYDELDLGFRFDSGLVGLRFETNRNSEDDFTYAEVTQRYAEWSDGRLTGRVGNFYTILGRGLVHRSFEIPGVVLEQGGLRSRFAPSRDVDGALAEASWRGVNARLLAGRPGGGEFSPAAEDLGFERYSGFLGGGQLSVAPARGAMAGAAFSRLTDGGRVLHEVGSGFVEVDPLRLAGAHSASLPIYVEYAQRGATFSEWWRIRTDDETPHALYVGSNLLWGPLGLSAEWKDYTGFRLGTNDPPSLVREHSAPLLNRNTHVLDAEREQGYQLEGTLTRPSAGSFTVNVSRGEGAFASRKVVFEERYFELESPPRADSRWNATVFYADGKDEFVAITDRTIYGGAVTVRFLPEFSATADVERQEAKRPPFKFEDLFVSLTLARADWGSASFLWERTTDPEQEDPEKALDDAIDPRHFAAGVVEARLSRRHTASLFYGERRGGRACTAGTCYEVLPFKGVELRIVTVL